MKPLKTVMLLSLISCGHQKVSSKIDVRHYLMKGPQDQVLACFNQDDYIKIRKVVIECEKK